MTETPAEEALRRVTETARTIERQRALVEHIRSAGQNSASAETLLTELEALHAEHEQRLRWLTRG